MGSSDRSVTQYLLLPAVLLSLLCSVAIHSLSAAEPDHMAALGIVQFDGDIAALDFVLPTPEGQQRRLSDFKGKVVLLNFWATW